MTVNSEQPTHIKSKPLPPIERDLTPELKALVADHINISTADQIPHDLAMADLGLDSLASMEIVESLQSKYGLQVSSDDVGALTVHDLIEKFKGGIVHDSTPLET